MQDRSSSLSKRVLSLSMARDQKAASTVVSTLRTYRTYSRMVCADEVAAIESRLLGEKTGEVTKRARKRMAKQAATDAHWKAIRNGYIDETATETRRAGLLCRWNIGNLGQIGSAHG